MISVVGFHIICSSSNGEREEGIERDANNWQSFFPRFVPSSGRLYSCIGHEGTRLSVGVLYVFIVCVFV